MGREDEAKHHQAMAQTFSQALALPGGAGEGGGAEDSSTASPEVGHYMEDMQDSEVIMKD